MSDKFPGDAYPISLSVGGRECHSPNIWSAVSASNWAGHGREALARQLTWEKKRILLFQLPIPGSCMMYKGRHNGPEQWLERSSALTYWQIPLPNSWSPFLGIWLLLFGNSFSLPGLSSPEGFPRAKPWSYGQPYFPFGLAESASRRTYC